MEETLALRERSPVRSPSRSLPISANIADKILKSFNTWAFKREQPSDTGLLTERISQAMSKHEPISFVLYWGKGPRDAAAKPDHECLDYLAALARRVGETYARGAQIELILTNTHAELNGHSQARIWSYFGDIERAAADRGFQTHWLGHIVDAYGSSLDELANVSVPPDFLGQLVRSADKWYRGGGAIEAGAERYYRMNMIERRAVELTFPGSVFVTFNGSESRPLFPLSMPIFYMYSLRRGVGVKPWFLTEDGVPAVAQVA